MLQREKRYRGKEIRNILLYVLLFYYSLSTIAMFSQQPNTETLERGRESYLGKIDVEEEGLFGVGDLDAVLLVR